MGRVIQKQKKGFTLVELVVVIAILAILAAIALPTINHLIKDANTATATANLHTIESAYKVAVAEVQKEGLYEYDPNNHDIIVYNPALEDGLDQYLHQKINEAFGGEDAMNFSFSVIDTIKNGGGQFLIFYYPEKGKISPNYSYDVKAGTITYNG